MTTPSKNPYATNPHLTDADYERQARQREFDYFQKQDAARALTVSNTNEGTVDSTSNPEHLGPRLKISPSRIGNAQQPIQQPYSMGPQMPASNAGLGEPKAAPVNTPYPSTPSSTR